MTVAFGQTEQSTVNPSRQLVCAAPVTSYQTRILDGAAIIDGQTRDCQFNVTRPSLIMSAALLPTPDADVSVVPPTI